MSTRTTLAILVALIVSGCVTLPETGSIRPGESFQLVSVDGRSAGARGFFIQFAGDGTYAARFECGDHFGTFTAGEVLSLQPGASAPGACDRVDLRTGRAIVTPPSYARDFFAAPSFAVERRGAGVTLVSRTHRFRFQEPASSTATHLPVLSSKPDVMLTALARGRLMVRAGCIRIVGKGDGDGMLVIWPAGSQLVTDNRRQIVVVGGSGRRLVVGSNVSLGGGGSDQFDPEALTEPLPPTCSGPYFSGY